MDEVEGGLQIDIDHEIPLVFGHTHHETVTCDPSVID